MKIGILIAMTMGWTLNLFACVDLSGVYELVESNCDKEIIPELSLPTNSGKISLKKNSIITVQQKKCDEYLFKIKHQELNINKVELTKKQIPDFQFSKYGIIISEELKKIKKDSPHQSIPGRKISINTQWNLDLIGNGNLVLKFKQEVRNHKLLKSVVKDVNQVCELYNLN
jgi:hypothetical protein